MESVHMQNVCDLHAGFVTGVCLQLCAQKCGCPKFCTFIHVQNVHMQNVQDVRAGFATGVCLQLIMCAKVWMHEILHIHTRAKCAHEKCVQCASRFCNWSLFAIMCAKVWMCVILYIHTRANCVPFYHCLVTNC